MSLTIDQMDVDEVVDTSDVDEQEILGVSEADHWTLYSPQKVPYRDASGLPASSSSNVFQTVRVIDHTPCLPSPRKRLKTSHDDLWPPESLALTPAVASPDQLPHPVDTPQCSGPTASHEVKPQEFPKALENTDCSGESPTRMSLFSSPPHYSQPTSSLGHSVPTTDVVDRLSVSPSASKPPRSSHSSRSISTEPRSLFSSPMRRYTSPPATSSQGQAESSNLTPGTLTRRATVQSSPLTPVSSPVPYQTRLNSSPDELRLISSDRHSSTMLTADLAETFDVSLIPGDTELPLGRYSLRRRDPRQINPYAYDKLLYKQQMRSNPDAIVKFRSPVRRAHGQRVDEQDETQSTYVFPPDNPEEDEDYVESIPNPRKGSSNTNLEQVEEAPDDRDTGWLPEVLQPLSSSDEGDDEIRKLAKKARREREKAEAKARAAAKKAEDEARKAHLEAKKSRVRRKAFPMSSPSSRFALSSRRGTSIGLSSPKSFARAHSEPTSSPVRPQPTQELPSRASSYSPIPGSNPRQSPELNYDYQQEDHFQHFNDFDEPLERDPSPAPIPVFEPPSSPSIANTGTQIVLSLDESTNDTSSSSVTELTAKDRKGMRALRRMMPAAMIARHLAEAKQHRRPRAHSLSSSDSEAKEVPLIPGLARVRKSAIHRDIEIIGDPESSEVEPPGGGEEGNGDGTRVNSPSSGHSSVKISRIRRASPGPSIFYDEPISLDDSLTSSIENGSGSDGDSEGVGKWSVLPALDRPRRESAREKSLIDWMLTRTTASNDKKRTSRKSRSSKAGAHSRTRLDIVTSGVKRYKERQQTLLSFVKPSAPRVPLVKKPQSGDWSAEHIASSEDAVNTKRKNRKGHRNNTPGPLYSLHHDGVKIASKHHEPRLKRGPGSLMIGDDDDDLHQVLDPSWKAEIGRWNKPVSSRRPTMESSKPPSMRQHYHASPIHPPPAPFALDRGSPPPVSIHRYIVPDMSVRPLRSGVKFGPSTYLGKGLLHKLVSVISGEVESVAPPFCHSQAFSIGPTTSAAEFAGILGPLYDQLADVLRSDEDLDGDKDKDWEHVLRTSCLLTSWLGTQAENEEFGMLETAIKEYSSGFLAFLSGVQPSFFSLTVHWFLLELATRLAACIKHRRTLFTWDDIDTFSKQLLQHILVIDLQTAFLSFYGLEDDIETTTLSHRAAELWICLMHLLGACDSLLGDLTRESPRYSFWRLLVEMYPESSPTGAEASEHMWRTMFSICALSQFSVHGLSTSVFRLPPAWDLVAVALKKIVLTANPEKERQLPPRALRKRDDYLTCIVSRCFLLWSRWHWRLDEATPMFKTLQEIFRSRNFVNLRSEKPTYMGFLERGDLELLSKSDHHDSVFEVFLKMVVQAVHSSTSDMDSRQKTSNVKKLLQIAVPVSPVPFTKTAPPTNHELSMLVNRFSAMAVAIHLDPTDTNVRFRVGQARRCVNFKDADDASRMACIYGMMYFATIMRHHRLSLDDVLGWLADMANVLMDDYKDAEPSQKDGKTGLSNIAKRSAITLIQLLLGSVRKIIETESLDKDVRNEYPDPALLDGPWVTRVFNPGTNLVTLSQTGLEIRMLVQAFLNARTRALPPKQPSELSLVMQNQESQESQEEYEKLYLELNDAELLAALGEEPIKLVVADIKAKEDALCKVLDKSITPAVYRLVCKHLGESENETAQESRTNVADKWIECWVGCANVLIQNGNKDWSLYMKLGQQSWEKIINASWRRRVGLRFNLSLLHLDPSAYPKYQDEFVSVLLVASVSSKLTIEHEYASVVFTLGKLRHPLLQGAPFEPVGPMKRFEIGELEFQEKRVELLKVVISNAAERVRAGMTVESEVYVGFLISMFSAMRDIFEVKCCHSWYAQPFDWFTDRGEPGRIR
ncbi:Mus7/MMS22 family-domain-containing protein [Scleroderma citrinum]